MMLTGYWFEDRDGLGMEIWLDTGNVWHTTRVHENAPWLPFDLLAEHTTEAEWRADHARERIEELPEGLRNLLLGDFPQVYRYAWEAAQYPEWQGYYRIRVRGWRALYDTAEHFGADQIILMRGAAEMIVDVDKHIELVCFAPNGREAEHA